MPTATSFTALGKGNGFNRCLSSFEVTEDQIINPVTLEEAVNAYWNFDSMSFGGASFNPDNQPKDLICNESDNRGSDENYLNPKELFIVNNSFPKKYNVGDKIYYAHGISFEYSTGESGDNPEKFTSVHYTSTVPSLNVPEASNVCSILETSTTYGSVYTIGKSTLAFEKNVSSVTIGGLPFVKTVSKSFYGEDYDDPVGSGNATCPLASFLSETSEVPSLTLHTY
tara:strand:+ start:244 stop:921 length:678 start_codon:yes stop_codon:yes gene_type:complete